MLEWRRIVQDVANLSCRS